MRAVHYFLRSRRAGSTTAALAVVAALGWFVVDGPLGSPQNVETRLVWASLYLPLLAAMIISAGTHAPFGEIEHTASTSLAALRLVHVALLFLWSLATLEFLTLGRTLPDAWLLPARNLAGFTGIALLTARVSGAHLSWIVPMIFTVAVMLIGAPGSADSAPWAWPVQPPTDAFALASAATLLAAGLTTAVLVGPREARGEAPA